MRPHVVLQLPQLSTHSQSCSTFTPTCFSPHMLYEKHISWAMATWQTWSLCLGHLCHPGAGLQCERGVLLPEGWYAEQGEAGGPGEGLHCTMNWDRNELECLSNLVSKSSENNPFGNSGR